MVLQCFVFLAMLQSLDVTLVMSTVLRSGGFDVDKRVVEVVTIVAEVSMVVAAVVVAAVVVAAVVVAAVVVAAVGARIMVVAATVVAVRLVIVTEVVLFV